MNDALRNKIARALSDSATAKARKESAHVASFDSAAGYVRKTLTEQADAVLAVLDLDKVRSEAWDEGFDAGQAWESDMNSRVIPSADRQDNPYRKADR